MAGNDKIPETYVSPAVRWAFFMEDYPEATVTYDVVKAADADIPAEFRGDVDLFVRATITTHDKTYTAEKEVKKQEWRKGYDGQPGKMVNVDRTPELFVKLRTMALGRALKQAGYPDDEADFRLMLTWRERNRRLDAAPALPPAAPIAALPAAEPTTVVNNYTTEIVTSARPDDEIVDAELVESDSTAVDRLAELIGSMPSGPTKVALLKRAAGMGVYDLSKATEEQAVLLLSNGS